MRYELQPDNRDCPDDELVADLCAVARRLAKASLTKDEYDRNGRFSSATMQKRFGSWNKALIRSDLAVTKRVGIPSDEMLADMRRVAKELSLGTVSSILYRTHGKFGRDTITRRFGSWDQALAAAGLKPTGHKRNLTDEELFSNMANVWEHVGGQPKQSDFHPPLSRVSSATYANRFGSWRKALEAFVAIANSEESSKPPIAGPVPIVCAPSRPSRHRTQRFAGWRLRHLVMRRDDFKCRHCGRSPSTHPGTILVIDHIKPWDEGGETVTANLQTLCEPCNGGKSDLHPEKDNGGQPEH